MNKYTLGTIEASEQLIRDLYINIRTEVNKWSRITNQTPQARMGYIGQHLVSVVTGYPGSKSGARGYDLVMDNGSYGEIKTCYRVDQLGKCRDCDAVVSSTEKKCSNCGSINIMRKEDSKWLIGIQHDQAFSEITTPKYYYFVLFEPESIDNSDNIIISIWEVNPQSKGFVYCMIDYYCNIRAKSKSKAPFNMWPYELKFALTNPKLIYRSQVYSDGRIETRVFPTMNNTFIDQLKPLQIYSQSKILKIDAIKSVIKKVSYSTSVKGTKKVLLERLEQLRKENNISNKELCDLLSDAIYGPRIYMFKKTIPNNLQKYCQKLSIKHP